MSEVESKQDIEQETNVQDDNKVDAAANASQPEAVVGHEHAPQQTGLAALLTGAGGEKWVTIELKLVNWTFSNFKLRVRTSTRFTTIQHRLCEKHGDICKLRLFKDQVADEQEIVDLNGTLEDVGIVGALKSAPVVNQVIYYDFTPVTQHDPLLLVTPRQFNINVYDATKNK